MSSERTNPLDLAALGDYRAIILPQVDDLWKRIQSADDARQSYLQKQEKLLRQRRGIRKPKTMPWPGANNHNWPIIDSVCRRWKPGIVSLVLQADPVCYFWAKKAEGLAAAPVAQEYYNWRFTHITGIRETIMELAENVFQYGKAYAETGWEYRTEKSCRLVRTKDLFPQGFEAAAAQYNAAVRAKRAEAEAAVTAGQAPPEVLEQIPSEVDVATFVLESLKDQYALAEEIPLEAKQLIDATDAILKGATVVKFYYQIVRSDKPCLKAHDPRGVIVPPRGTSTEDADFIALEYFFSVDDLLKMASDGLMFKDAVASLVLHMKSRSQGDPYRDMGPSALAGGSGRAINDVLDRAEGLMTGQISEPALERVYKIYCKLDINGDGINERCVMWYHPGGGEKQHPDARGTILAAFPMPYPFCEWPVVAFEFEHTSGRPYSSRGAAELLSVFQAATNKLHNARLDAIQIVLAPMLVMRVTAGDEARNIRFMPGGIIPVTQVGDVAPLQMDPTPLVHLLQEENYTKGQAEQYIGVFDPGILAENSTERRTATEVTAVTQQTQSIFGQDATLFQSAMAKVHRQLWLLDQEFAEEELCYRVTGDPNPRTVKKYELAHDYDIEPKGTPANTNQAFARQKALEAIQLFGADMTGLINKHELFKHYFDVTDRNLGKVLVRSENEAALLQMMMQNVAQMQEMKGEKANVPPPP